MSIRHQLFLAFTVIALQLLQWEETGQSHGQNQDNAQVCGSIAHFNYMKMFQPSIPQNAQMLINIQ